MHGFAQRPHPSFRQYTVEAGLPSSEIYQVRQDSKGYIWLATGNGVSRYNGYEFENFSLSDGLPDNTVFEIYEDPRGRVWFVPLSCKLSYYENGKIHLYKYNDLLLRDLKNPLKSSFCVRADGTVFLGVSHAGIFEISPDGKMKNHLSENRMDTSNIAEILVMEPIKGTYIYSDYPRLRTANPAEYRIFFRTENLNTTVVVPLNSAYGFRPSMRFIQRRTGEVLFCNDKMLYVFDRQGGFRVVTFDNTLNWIYEDTEGNIWLTSHLGGVYLIDGKDYTLAGHYFNEQFFSGVTEDREGGLWLSSVDGALFYTACKNVLTYDQIAGMGADKVSTLTGNGKHIFVAQHTGFIYEIGEEGIVKSYNTNLKGSSPNDIINLYHHPVTKNIWYSGTTRGGVIKNGKIDETIHTASSYYKVLYDSSDKLTVSGPEGLYVFENNMVVPIKKDFKTRERKRVNALLKDAHRDSVILLGCTDGLWCFYRKGGELEFMGKNNPDLRHRVLDLDYLNDSILILSTKGAGLIFYDGKNTRQISVAQGLCGDNVYQCVVDGNDVWAGTNRGLSRVRLDLENNAFQIRNYTTQDGLAFNEIIDLAKHDGKIWVASNKGVTFFDPDEVEKKLPELPIYINKISINDADTAYRETYTLPYDQNNIKIHFIGLGYRNAGKLRYRYKMLGLDTNWIYTGNREIQFTTLPAGEYEFVVSVQNASGDWSTHVASARFVITAPVWQKWWFQVLGVLLLVVVVLYIFRYRFRVAQREKEKSDSLNRNLLNLKLKALRAQMNPHFTFNVMNSIQHFILHKDDESAHRYLSKFSRLIRTILNNSETDTVPVAEEIKALGLYLELESMRFEQQFGYEINVDENIDANEVLIPSMLIQPYVENAILHGILPSGREGRIRIEIMKRDTHLECIIEDNGIGRTRSSENNRNKEYKSFGTTITKERLAVINELYDNSLSEKVVDLYDENGIPSGTRIIIYIPLIKTDAYESGHH